MRTKEGENDKTAWNVELSCCGLVCQNSEVAGHNCSPFPSNFLSLQYFYLFHHTEKNAWSMFILLNRTSWSIALMHISLVLDCLYCFYSQNHRLVKTFLDKGTFSETSHTCESSGNLFGEDFHRKMWNLWTDLLLCSVNEAGTQPPCVLILPLLPAACQLQSCIPFHSSEVYHTDFVTIF